MGMNEQAIGEIAVTVGEVVEVLEGPFAHFQGKVEEIDVEKGKVKVTVDMFGRETKMELRLYTNSKNIELFLLALMK